MGIRALDRMTLLVIALGLVLALQPWWPGGLKVGFFTTIVGVVAQIVTSHLLPEEPA